MYFSNQVFFSGKEKKNKLFKNVNNLVRMMLKKLSLFLK